MNKQPAKFSAGAAMVEFALIVTLLVMLVFGITELGRALFQWNTLTKAVVTGTRYMARANGEVVNPDCTEGANWAAFRDRAENLVKTGQTASGGTELLNAITVTTFEVLPRQFSYSGNTKNACVINIVAQSEFDSIFGGSIIPFINLDLITLTARTEERYIGE
ncbi:TadE family protein [Sulfuriflexus sp.]|uniref:TadE family protein n=1 Tax=Sulfuriflexus sp. TaxID=2015443 RepID=UPI0028CCA578|nr:TadE/TadG family type IV pilus assembly protein [Sulfuriflexus sp.]MDT8403037.1 TadE/TadG family type IV pilus assembly protein [Sulfuriflexus sp.]